MPAPFCNNTITFTLCFSIILCFGQGNSNSQHSRQKGFSPY